MLRCSRLVGHALLLECLVSFSSLFPSVERRQGTDLNRACYPLPEMLHQRWDITANDQIKNRLTGTCLTAGNNLIGSNVFMIDCYQIVIGEDSTLAGKTMPPRQ